jgi:DNA mismatch repair ATPase MutS
MVKGRIKKLVVMAILGSMVAACSSFNNSTQDAVEEALTNEQRQDLLGMLKKNKENEALLAQWQQSKAGVARLLAIESDLKLLIEQLSQLSSENDDTTNGGILEAVTPSVDTPTYLIEIPDKVANKVAEPIADINRDVNGLFTVQLSAMNKEENIISVWKGLVKEHPNILAGLLPSTERVELLNGPIYRLKVGPFNNLKDANLVCSKLRLENIPCIVSQYTSNAELAPLKLN